MTISIEQRAEQIFIKGELNIYTAHEGRDRLVPLLANASAVHLDLAGVIEMDTAGLQLLLMTQRMATSLGKPFRVVNLSAAVRDVVDLCQVHELGSTVGRAA